MTWMLINTAPQDGTPVDVWTTGGRWTNACYRNSAWYVWGRDGFESPGWERIEYPVTHWMPLPEPPLILSNDG